MTKAQRRKVIKGLLKKLWPIIQASAQKSLEMYLENELKKHES